MVWKALKAQKQQPFFLLLYHSLKHTNAKSIQPYRLKTLEEPSIECKNFWNLLIANSYLRSKFQVSQDTSAGEKLGLDFNKILKFFERNLSFWGFWYKLSPHKVLKCHFFEKELRQQNLNYISRSGWKHIVETPANLLRSMSYLSQWYNLQFDMLGFFTLINYQNYCGLITDGTENLICSNLKMTKLLMS